MGFGEYFRAIRQEKNVTQREIAEAIGKTTMLVSGVELNKNGPFCNEDLDIVSSVLRLTDEERNVLKREAAKQRGTITEEVKDYMASHDNIYILLETIVNHNLNERALEKLVRCIEENTICIKQ